MKLPTPTAYPSSCTRVSCSTSRATHQNITTPSFTPKRSTGFTLMEMLLGLVILAAGIIGVYKLLGNAQSNAALEQEQNNAGALIDGVLGQYMAADTFTGLTTAVIVSSDINGLKRSSDGTGLLSAFNTPILVRPSQVSTANDAFDIVYRNLDEKQCLSMVKTLYSRSYQIFVNEISDSTTGVITTAGQSVQYTNGSSEGRLAPDSTLTNTSNCRHQNFKDKVGVVAFRFFGRKTDVTLPVAACACSPDIRDQADACPSGQSGEITTRYTGACTGGTASCPLLIETASVLSNTCTPDPGACAIPAGTTRSWTVGGNSCSETTTEGRSIVSGSTWQASDTGAPTLGQAGFVCTNGALSAAASPGATCTLATSCIAGSENRTQACSAGQVGIIVETRTSSCATPSSTPVWGTWTQTSNSCQTPGVVNNPTCTPTTSSRDLACPSGQFGLIHEEMSTTCATPSSTPATGPWVEQYRTCVTNSCQSTGTCCQASSNTANPGCPSGYTGTRTTRQDSTCASPTASPVWGSWYDEVNTCVITGCTIPANTTFNWTVGGQSCTYTAAAQTIASGSNLNATDSTAPATGLANFLCNNGAISTSVPNAGATCVTASTCPVGQVMGYNPVQWADPPGGSGASGCPVDSSWITSSEALSDPSYDCANASHVGNTITWDEGDSCNFQHGGYECRNTCGPPPCSVASGTTLTWTQSGQTCTQTLSSALSIPVYDFYRATDTVGTTGAAQFRCMVSGGVSALEAIPTVWSATDHGGRWASYNATCTATPTNCGIGAGTVFNWTVAGQSCTYTSGATTITNGANLNATDSVAPATGAATFTCVNGNMNVTPNAGATCATAPLAACSPSGSYMTGYNVGAQDNCSDYARRDIGNGARTEFYGGGSGGLPCSHPRYDANSGSATLSESGCSTQVLWTDQPYCKTDDSTGWTGNFSAITQADPIRFSETYSCLNGSCTPASVPAVGSGTPHTAETFSGLGARCLNYTSTSGSMYGPYTWSTTASGSSGTDCSYFGRNQTTRATAGSTATASYQMRVHYRGQSALIGVSATCTVGSASSFSSCSPYTYTLNGAVNPGAHVFSLAGGSFVYSLDFSQFDRYLFMGPTFNQIADNNFGICQVGSGCSATGPYGGKLVWGFSGTSQCQFDPPSTINSANGQTVNATSVFSNQVYPTLRNGSAVFVCQNGSYALQSGTCP